MTFNWEIQDYDYNEMTVFFIGFILTSSLYMKFFDQWKNISELHFTYIF